MNSKTIISKTADVSLGPLRLTSGEQLEQVTLRYELVGPADAPVILVCHALTGNHLAVGTADNPGWWRGLIGPDSYIDTDHYQVLTFNVLGGCHGSTGPASINPETNESYTCDFPAITVRDMVHAQYRALQQLNITRLEAVIGGSLGGMQVLEWGILYPDIIEKLIVLAATPVFSDYGIAFNHIASTAIKQDPHWNNGDYQTDDSFDGLALARMIGMITYRTSDLFTERFNRNQTNNDFDVVSYLNYQGQKLVNRFDPNSYLYLLDTMNQHDIGFNRGGWREAASQLNKPTLLLSYDKDLIYEPKQIKTLADMLPDSTYHHIETNFGHDGFLTEFEKWGHIVNDFLHQGGV
ncbi:homoserine O-acetyltransferase MetX [Virgibacillus doumboii]|uniref:homoserine O-acetyltransferase MetX n=1 Tax=Virgibacillus doumboii TaxID=2697503 RepID=UPI001FE7D18D|nr:homoserine O-acetyltransferase [Virgibacillus doumboii]